MIFHQAENSRGAKNFNATFYTDRVWESHFHKSYEIVLVVQGLLECSVGEQTVMLGAGELALCLPYQPHSYRPGKDCRYWVCVFSEEYVRFFAKQMKGKTGSECRFVCSDTVLQYIQGTLMQEAELSEYMIKSCLYALCAEYLRCVPVVESNQDKTQHLHTIISFIEEHYTENITLSNIAELLGYDYHYVSRYFHSVFHMTFRELLNVYRLERAVQLMDETDQKLVEIAYACGFQSLRTFNRCFHAHFGISPSRFRKQEQ